MRARREETERRKLLGWAGHHSRTAAEPPRVDSLIEWHGRGTLLRSHLSLLSPVAHFLVAHPLCSLC